MRARAIALSALDSADAEDELLESLERLDVREPWRLTEPLVAAGIDAAWLDRLADIAGRGTSAAVEWIAASLTARGLAAEIAESTERMSKLVKAIKAYAFMDRGELVETDVHEGLETTLLVLGHKLKHTSIEVRREYDRSLPKITLRGSELNQVWTNLLANAIEALGDKGRSRSSPNATAPARASTSSTTAPESPRTSAVTCSTRSSPPRTSARAPGSGSTPRAGSSPSA